MGLGWLNYKDMNEDLAIEYFLKAISLDPSFALTDEFFKLIFETKELFENINVIYQIDDGTLLGIVREGNIIKGDHDFDFSVKYDDI